MNREVYPKVKQIMSKSAVEAKVFEDIKVRPEHILLSLLSDNDNTCTKILKEHFKIDVLDLYDKFSDFIRKNDLTPRGYTSTRKTLPFSDEYLGHSSNTITMSEFKSN